MESTCFDIRLLFEQAADGVLSLEAGRYYGNICFTKQFVVQNLTDSRQPILLGPIMVGTSNVMFRGLKFTNNLTISESCSDIHFDDCVFTGSVRIAQGCFRVFFKNCVISPERNGVGISMLSPGHIRLLDCSFIACLVAVSIQTDIVGSAEMTSDLFCLAEGCNFTNNSTDIVVRISLLGPFPSVFFPSTILHAAPSPMIWDVSISGKFQVPMVFKEWPLPLLDCTLPRRGGNRRNCYVKTKSNGVHVSEDELPTSPRKNRKRSSLAEIHYTTVLGLELGSSRAEVSAAFKKLALIHHPDKCTTNNDTAEFIKIKNARDVLTKILDK